MPTAYETHPFYKVYDRVDHKFKRGYTMLTMGWTDSNSLIPVCFNLLSFAEKRNLYKEINCSIDHRTNGYKDHLEALMKKPEAAVLMIKRALETGIAADDILMDTWFTTEPMIRVLLETGIHMISMVKQLKQRYRYNGKDYTLPQLRQFM